MKKQEKVEEIRMKKVTLGEPEPPGPVLEFCTSGKQPPDLRLGKETLVSAGRAVDATGVVCCNCGKLRGGHATQAAIAGTHRRHPTYHTQETDGTQGWKVEDHRRGGEPHTEGVAHSTRPRPVSGSNYKEKTPTAPTAAPADQLLGPTHMQTTQNVPTPLPNKQR